ncbi:hypothetical protein AF332_11865 [Sporosarcina globispora]|uniref:Uncharacterized protein n=1 Tax=Sporosarcina globispora TaxID=1459 RepID=A0A0M0GC38_SPOGL|nr:hypothetical protein [Sporosarcina globispora]KON87455.1 hypothetical protein AF332_11865 [Sporosarcina globispora]
MDKNLAIKLLKEMNKTADELTVVTRLYFNNDNDYVQGFSFFANEEYMSEGLLEALQYGQTLTTDQEEELRQYLIEKHI